MQIASVPGVSTRCASGNLLKWSASGISAEHMTVLAPAQRDVSHCAQQMGAGKLGPSIEVCIHMHKYIYILCVRVTRPWQSCCQQRLTGLCLGPCAFKHPCMALARRPGTAASPANGCSRPSNTKPSGPLLSPCLADSPAGQTHLFPGYGYCGHTEFRSNLLRSPSD